MPEKTKENEDGAKSDVEKPENESEDCRADEQKKSYYYDDAYGYEVYDPNADDEDETAEMRNADYGFERS